ncbi:MAG: hypothetical protein BAJALOKI2v1_370004 [Promethearchaeota archaeon]|nr:MAG: hypothetical protein BAJALOKI2v1_370004 [Candidatus Lokiarchaeota archaeon]
MESQSIIICELKGIENSNPEMVSSFPGFQFKEFEKNDLIPKFLPYGSEIGDFQISNLSKHIILSYIFKIKNPINRDDLLSISVMIKKKKNMEIFKPILKKIIDELDRYNLLNEEILKNNLNKIFDAINKETDIIIEGNIIEISKLYKELKNEYLKKKPKLEGNFF